MSTQLIPIGSITSLIYQIRGYKVMLDKDLAELYGVETKRLKEQARRNIERFQIDFMFELATDEHENLRSQIATSSWGGPRYAPMAFTEHGVLMLSTVLKSDKAIQVNIQIMRAFSKLRHLVLDNADLRKEIESLRTESEGKFQIIFQALDQLMLPEEAPRKKIGFTAEETMAGFGG